MVFTGLYDGEKIDIPISKIREVRYVNEVRHADSSSAIFNWYNRTTYLGSFISTSENNGWYVKETYEEVLLILKLVSILSTRMKH